MRYHYRTRKVLLIYIWNCVLVSGRLPSICLNSINIRFFFKVFFLKKKYIYIYIYIKKNYFYFLKFIFNIRTLKKSKK